MDMIKLASTVVRQYGGEIVDVEEFIQSASSSRTAVLSEEALAALASFKDLSAAID